MKLIAFSLIYFSLLVSLSGYKVPWKFAFWVSLLYVFLLRQGGFQGDFNVYLEELRSGWFSVYYIKEPLFWVGSKILFSCLGSERVVIFIYDVLFCLFLLKSVKKVADVEVFFILLVSFPIFLGLENIYRQLLGFPFSFLFIYYCFRAKPALSLFYLLIAVLFHNSYIVLAPIFIFSVPKISVGIRYLVTILAFLPVFLFLNYADFSVFMVGKSTAQSTGLDLVYLYAAVLVLVSFSVVFINRRFTSKWSLANLIIYLLYFAAINTLGSAQSERVGMILLLAQFFIYFCLYGGAIGRDNFVKLEMFILLAVPIFIISSTRNFLIVGGN